MTSRQRHFEDVFRTLGYSDRGSFYRSVLCVGAHRTCGVTDRQRAVWIHRAAREARRIERSAGHNEYQAPEMGVREAPVVKRIDNNRTERSLQQSARAGRDADL